MRACLLAFLLFAGLLAAQRPARADFFSPPTTCRDVASAIATARRNRDVARLPNIWRIAQDHALGCSDKQLYCNGRAIALGFLDEGYRLADQKKSSDEIEAVLSQGEMFGSPWQLLATVGQLRLARAQAAHSAPLYEIATKDLQDALNASVEPPSCAGERAAPAAAVDDLRRKSGEAGLLAAHFVSTPTRDGGCGGIFLAGERGFGAVPTPVPIRFGFDQAAMTGEGEKAAATMRDCILEKKFVRVVLSGHTDDAGPDDYNLDLSARRLATVRDFLIRGGYKGEIVLLPKGKREPFKVDDPGKYGPEEIDQFNRRVEIREGTP